MSKTDKAYVEVYADENGQIQINTNLSALGAIHLLAQTQQVIINRTIEQQEALQEETEEIKEN